MTDRNAFTLIELLVVVTIIVVLLALLMPALDKTIYQAELTMCGVNMKGVGNAVTTYAMEHGRYYPRRMTDEIRAHNLSGNDKDVRPPLIPYMPLSMLIDPLCESVDISIESNDASIYTYSSNWLWFGWTLDASNRGMKRLGDAMRWTDEAGQSHVFDTLMSDAQAMTLTNFNMQSSHPDRENMWYNTPEFQVLCGICGGWRLTFSFWRIGNYRPGYTTDGNFLYADLSVTRLNRITYDATNVQHDERLVQVPEYNDGTNDNWKNYLPKRSSR